MTEATPDQRLAALTRLAATAYDLLDDSHWDNHDRGVSWEWEGAVDRWRARYRALLDQSATYPPSAYQRRNEAGP